MSKTDQRRAAFAGNAAIRKLAQSFELAGLNQFTAMNSAAKIVNDARLNVEINIGKFLKREAA